MNQLLTVDEAAQFLRLKKSTIRMWIFRGKIPKVKLGRCVRIQKDDLEHLIKSNTYPNKQAWKEEKNE